MNTRQQLAINQVASAVALSLRGMHGTRDAKHSLAWSDYGYKDTLTFNDHYQMYRRFGIAKAGIKTPPNHCWKTKPKVFIGDEDDERDDNAGNSTFELSIKRIFKKLKLWKKLKLVDEYQRVGNYGAFVIQIRGQSLEADWSKPLGGITENQIVRVIPLYQEQIKPATWESDESSERYGQPVTYNFQESNIADSNDSRNQGRSVTVHHTRVITFAEGADDDSIYGVPANEGGYNDLVTMEKIIGAGGEGFWKNASMKTAFSSISKDTRPLDEKEIDAVDEAITDFMEGMDKHLMLGGLKGDVLSTALSDPKEFFMIALQSYSASVEIASKILVGAQEGRLAADEDGRFTLSNFQSRREDWCTDMVTDVVDWMIEHKVIDEQEYFVEWDDLLAPSDKDKFELGVKLTDVIEKLARSTGEMPISPNEVAKVMGYTPEDNELDLPVDGEGDIDDDESE